MLRKLFSAVAASAVLVSVNAGMVSAQVFPEREIFGTVAAFSPYNLQLADGQHVSLHNGTVLRPLGLTLSPGMHVRILGHYAGRHGFAADEVDLREQRPYFYR